MRLITILLILSAPAVWGCAQSCPEGSTLQEVVAAQSDISDLIVVGTLPPVTETGLIKISILESFKGTSESVIEVNPDCGYSHVYDGGEHLLYIYEEEGELFFRGCFSKPAESIEAQNEIEILRKQGT